MKHIAWISAAACAAAALWAVAQMQAPQPGPASLMPDGSLLYLEAKDFASLLHDWNTSGAKRVWLAGDDYAAFSRSRLFERLSQAQSEFSSTASVPADANLLAAVAGDQSALALYDIGNLQFVYVTRMDEAKAETTPLWQVRDKFEQRAEDGARFYVREDQQSNRTAAFAFDKGWLILGTRADLVAGVLDRLEGKETHGLPDEAWYADAVKQATAPAGDLRMVLNLDKIVPSPYFRSYWVQRNMTEMKQYRAGLCDLHRTADEYRETRVLLRSPGTTARVMGDVMPLLALAPEDAVFASAQSSPSPEEVLTVTREDVLNPQPEQAQAQAGAPPAAGIENAGRASDLEQRIDVAPILAKETDAYAGLRGLLQEASPSAMLEVYRTQSSPRQMWVGIERGMVVQASSPWNEAAVRDALTATLRRGLTASQLGIGWTISGNSGGVSSLNGALPIVLAVRGHRLYLANSGGLLSDLLSRASAAGSTQDEGVTYRADFHHTAHEQQVFRKLAGRLDAAGHETAVGSAAAPDGAGDGQAPAFFSGNVASLSRMWSSMDRETVTEKDKGEIVTQTVVYAWKQP